MRKAGIIAALAALVCGVIASPAGASKHAAKPANFMAGAAVESYTPPAAGTLQSDPADCLTAADPGFTGKRYFAFEEPYIDEQGDGHYDPGDPFIDCNHDGRWDGDTLGGGGDAPRYYDHVADPAGARALVISNGGRTVAMEVVDNEGLFNVYADRIRAKVAADGYRIDNIQISSTHDESAPDSIGLGGTDEVISGTNEYFVDYLVQQSALAIEQRLHADAARAHPLRRGGGAGQPPPVLVLLPVHRQPADAGDAGGRHRRPDDRDARERRPARRDARVQWRLADRPGRPDSPQRRSTRRTIWVTGDWPNWFRSALEQTYGGVGIEMAGSVGSVETPEVWSEPAVTDPPEVHRRGPPRRLPDAVQRPGRCHQGPAWVLQRDQALGQDLAGRRRERADRAARRGRRTTRSGPDTVNICVPVANALFKAAAIGGTFAERPAYLPGCRKLEKMPVAPTGQTAGTSVQSQVAAWRIGDAEFIGAPGEVFPFTFFRGPVGPRGHELFEVRDAAVAAAVHAHAVAILRRPRQRHDRLHLPAQGNDAGVPGEHVAKNPTASGTDRFGCGHSDDSESVNDKAGNIIGTALVGILSQHAASPEAVEQGRYVLPDGKLSRNPEGTTDTIKCTAPTDTTFAADGPAVAVWVPGRGVIKPASWIDLLGRPQTAPDRNTRGWIDSSGGRHWLDVFADISGQPQSVTP